MASLKKKNKPRERATDKEQGVFKDVGKGSVLLQTDVHIEQRQRSLSGSTGRGVDGRALKEGVSKTTRPSGDIDPS